MKAHLTAALLAAAALPALAATPFGGSASITGLRSYLVDLAPDDGIAPSASFFDVSKSFSAQVELVGDRGWESVYSSHTGGGTTSAMRSLARNGAQGAAATVAGFYGAPGLMTATGSATPGRPFDAFNVSSEYHLAVELSANTALVFEGSYSLAAWAKQRAGAAGKFGSMASVSFGTADLGHDSYSAEASVNPALGKSFQQLAGDFSFAFRNEGAASRLMFGGISAWTSGGQTLIGSEVAPIPEPGTYGLMLAGAGVVGIAVRRRKAASAAA